MALGPTPTPRPGAAGTNANQAIPNRGNAQTANLNPSQNNAATTANPRVRTLSARGHQQMRIREGDIPRYYNDPYGNNCTMGTGVLVHLGPCTPEEVVTPIDPRRANTVYFDRVREAEDAVNETVDEFPLTQEQFDALVSFRFNVGPQGDRVLDDVNDGRLQDAADRMNRYVWVTTRNRDGSPVRDAAGNPIRTRVRGLINRRQQETSPIGNAPSSNPSGGSTSAPSATPSPSPSPSPSPTPSPSPSPSGPSLNLA